MIILRLTHSGRKAFVNIIYVKTLQDKDNMFAVFQKPLGWFHFLFQVYNFPVGLEALDTTLVWQAGTLTYQEYLLRDYLGR